MKWDEPGAGISCCCAEVYVRHYDLEQVRGLLGHTRIETTQFSAQIRPATLKNAMNFYEAKALDTLSS